MGVTIKQIADACGVSRGTVDRALHNRGRVSAELAERIRKKAEELGYEPNAGARALALMKKEVTIGVILQFSETKFIQAVAEGTERAAAELESFGCHVRIERIPGDRPDLVAGLIREMTADGVRGIALVATEHESIRREIRACGEKGIRVVTFNSDLPDSGRLCFVGEEMKKGGRAAAGILGDVLRPGQKLAMFSGRRESRVQSEREFGFRETFSKEYPGIKIVSILHSDDDAAVLTGQIAKTLRKHPDLDGIYINSQGVSEACDLLRMQGLAKKLHLVVHDLAVCRREDVLDGTIDYVIDVNSFEQGYRPLMILFDLLYHGKEPEQEYYHMEMRIHTKYTIQ